MFVVETQAALVRSMEVDYRKFSRSVQ
jgi:hypothetical protein